MAALTFACRPRSVAQVEGQPSAPASSPWRRCTSLAATVSDSPDAADPVVETETISDTTVVRTVSGSVWKGNATLVPEVAVGELDGPEEYLFGSVGAIAVDDDHNFYILDEQAYNVRVFDSAGTYVTTLGREGEGPGEFKVPVGIAISDGRVLVRDPAAGQYDQFGQN